MIGPTEIIAASVLTPLALAFVIISVIQYAGLPDELEANVALAIGIAEAVLALFYGWQAHTEWWLVGHVSTVTQVTATTIIAVLVGAILLIAFVLLDLRNTGTTELDPDNTP